jgi:hypothetical protein
MLRPRLQITNWVPITDHEILIYLMKETADEEVAQKFILGFEIAGYQVRITIREDFKRIMFFYNGWIIQNFIDLYPGSFSTTINSEVKEYSYSVQNIESVFNEICDENDNWKEKWLGIKVRRVDEEDDDE